MYVNESSIQYVVAVIKVVLVEVLLKLLFLPECSVFVGRSSSAIWQGLSGPRPSTPPPPAFRFLANRSQDLAARSSSALAASLSITFLRLKPILWTYRNLMSGTKNLFYRNENLLGEASSLWKVLYLFKGGFSYWDVSS